MRDKSEITELDAINSVVDELSNVKKLDDVTIVNTIIFLYDILEVFTNEGAERGCLELRVPNPEAIEEDYRPPEIDNCVKRPRNPKRMTEEEAEAEAYRNLYNNGGLN